MKLIYQSLGTVCLVGIESKRDQEIIEQYYSFWNHQATGGGLHWMCETFAYITSNEEKLKKYFLNSSLHLILNKYPDTYKGVKGGAMDAAKQLAERRLLELKENYEVFMNTDPIVYDYSIGRTEARENPANSKAFDEEEWKQNAVNQRSRLQTNA
tara:strand:- start:61 stop:525 length:465 start_codon:yes stop_codon:yes gene_type:complete